MSQERTEMELLVQYFTERVAYYRSLEHANAPPRFIDPETGQTYPFVRVNATGAVYQVACYLEGARVRVLSGSPASLVELNQADVTPLSRRL